MVKNSRNKASEFYQQQTAEQISRSHHSGSVPHIRFGIGFTPDALPGYSSPPLGLGPALIYKPKAQTEICEQERIRVPHFRRGKQESETAYLRRMSQETRHVFFLAKNQPERHPERYLEEKAATSNREIKKKEFNKRRWLHKKKVKQQEYVVKDKVQFGEVAMAPPSLSVKPKKAPVKPQRASSSLLRSSILDHTDVSTAAPSLARQKIIGEEHERVVHAYRQLKRQIREQKAGINKYLNAQKRTRKL
ncbi:coiled-coil domain-containing protein 137 isoform X2 [Neoarius graeffei]|uniref:coiled-coil domain-containing protein 137 isoform X2 n=1 Tax=Neoarius graeffei TaxID=443677 RepID=UPI00298C7632|nr:coiled-coil domain-containing protein 137 isoform X2 [Neoarius graeffei]